MNKRLPKRFRPDEAEYEAEHDHDHECDECWRVCEALSDHPRRSGVKVCWRCYPK